MSDGRIVVRSIFLNVLASALLSAVATLPVAATTHAPEAHINVEDDERDYLAANGLLNRGLNDLAVKEYRKFLAAHPDHAKAPNAKYGLGVALYRLNNFQEAIDALNGLPQRTGFQFAAEAVLMLGQSHLSLQHFSEAGDFFELIVRSFPTHDSADEAAALQAESRYLEGRFDAVREPNLFIIKEVPDSPLRDRAELFWGLAMMAEEKFKDASARFEMLLERSPDGPFADRAALLLARSYQREGATANAIGQYQAVVATENEAFVPDALYSLAVLLRAQDEPEQAGEWLDELFDQYPDHELVPAARVERGRVHFDLKQYEPAFEQFEIAAASEQNPADALAYWLAKCELRLEQPAAAAARLKDAIAAHPKSDLQPQMQYDCAVAQLRAGEDDDAVATLAAFRSAFPQHEMAADALYLIATTQHHAGEYAGSRASCATFLKAYPQHPQRAEMLYLKGENAFLAGDFKAAAADFADYREQFPQGSSFSNATFRLGSALVRLDQAEDARELLESVTNGRDTPAPYRSALRQLGDFAFDSSDWETAIARYGEYLSFGLKMPAADDALLRLGLAQMRSSQFADAGESFSQLLANFETSVHRPQARFERAQAMIALKQPNEAVEGFTTLLAETPESRFTPYALNHLGVLAMQREDFKAAITAFEQLASTANVPVAMLSEALFQRGQAYMAVQEFEAAQEVFSSFIEAYPVHARAPLALANRIVASARLEQPEAVLSAWDAFEEADATASIPADLYTTLLYEKAWALRDTDQHDAARAVYEQLIERQSGVGEQGLSSSNNLPVFARLELAELLAQGDEHAEAVALLQPLVDAEAASTDNIDAGLLERALYRAGASRYIQEEFKAAAGYFARFCHAFEESDLFLSASLLQGESLFRIDRRQDAIEPLLRVVENEEADGETLRAPALLRLGESYLSVQDWKESEAAFARYLEEFPQSEAWFQAQFGLAFAIENQGRFDDAIAAYIPVVERHNGPTAARAQFQIGESLFAQKKHDEAVRELLKVDILYAYPEWSAAALYEAGRCFEAMAENGQARQHFEMVRDRYGDSRWAALARERLTHLSTDAPPGRGGGRGGGGGG
ncbi:MAG: tetratricopeptide repeat protein [Phycisphaerales bacterium]